MALVVWLLLWLSSSTAGQATLTPSLATGWPDKRVGERVTGRTSIHSDGSKAPSAMRGSAEPDEMLVKRTSRSSLRRPWLTYQQPIPHNHILPSVPPPLQLQGAAGHSHQTGLSTMTPSSVPAVAPSLQGPSAPHHEPGSSSLAHYKVVRRPYRSLKNNPTLKAEAKRDYYARRMQRLKDGVLINKEKPDGSAYAIATIEEHRAYMRTSARRRESTLTEEAKVKRRQMKKESARRVREKRKAQWEAEKEGRSWQGSPVRKPGRPRYKWDQEQVGAQQARRNAPANARIEKERNIQSTAERPLPVPMGQRR